jgi:hypothetical protein
MKTEQIHLFFSTCKFGQNLILNLLLYLAVSVFLKTKWITSLGNVYVLNFSCSPFIFSIAIAKLSLPVIDAVFVNEHSIYQHVNGFAPTSSALSFT